MPHIFISYAKKDTRELALALADALDALDGVTAWVDRSLKAGRAWELQIQAEIDRCDAMVVLYSPDINRHKNGELESYVLTEIAYAKYTARKPIIPVMAQATAPPISLTMEHYIDYVGLGLGVSDLVDGLCAEIGIENLSKRTSIFTPRYSHVSDILPGPFTWCEIPAGNVILGVGSDSKAYGVGQKFDVPNFAIAKYPVTNAQFRLFVQAGGYQVQKWWMHDGWTQSEREKWTEPRYWKDSKWKGANYPVVGVSWYEAVAFCAWLSNVTGEPITLPTEQQWQRAAQGDDDRLYSWGNMWDGSRCNNSVKPLDSLRTTLVLQYEGRDKGDSPFGVTDMVGNVWEWCLTAYEAGSHRQGGTNSRVIRGGAFYADRLIDFRVDSRRGDYPQERRNGVGFRLACNY